MFFNAFRWFLAPRAGRYWLVFIGLIASEVLYVMPPRLIGQVIDDIQGGRMTLQQLAAIAGLLAVLAVLHYAVIFIWSSALFGGELLIRKLLGSRLFRHLSGRTASFFRTFSIGSLTVLANAEIGTVSQAFGFGLLQLFSAGAGLTILLVSMSVGISWKLTLAVLIPLPFIAVWTKWAGKRIGQRWGAVNEAAGRLYSTVYEHAHGIKTVRAFGLDAWFTGRAARRNEQVTQAAARLAYWESLLQPVNSLLIGASYLICIGYGSYLIGQNQLTIGQLVAFTLYINMLVWPITAAGSFMNLFEKSTVSLKRLQAVKAAPADVREPERPVEAAGELGDIVFTGLSFRYPGAARNSLQGITLRLERGQTLGIVGPSGSGKSTLLLQLLRQYAVAPETLLLSGVPIERLPPGHIRQRIGYVPQQEMLLTRSIGDNIRLGRPEASDAEVGRAAALAQLEGDIARMPEGLRTPIGEAGARLSGGQRQRVAVARALLKDPELLLLDDALSSLDAKTEHELLQGILRQRQGRTMMIVTHRLASVRTADKIIVMDGGMIAESGDFRTLLARRGWFYRQYERQRQEERLWQEGRDELLD